MQHIRQFQCQGRLRIRRFLNGDTPRKRNKLYIDLQHRMEAEMRKLEVAIAQEDDNLKAAVLIYLDACSYLLAEFNEKGQTRKGERKRDVNGLLVNEPVNAVILSEPAVLIEPETPVDSSPNPSNLPYIFLPPTKESLALIADLLGIIRISAKMNNRPRTYFDRKTPLKCVGKAKEDGNCGFRSLIQCLFGPGSDDPDSFSESLSVLRLARQLSKITIG
ncbi:hypothetical protein L596_016493 [Steinernema carpocapsae]|uniref:Uncharacterized protein n=1 Tax=Steinernema carpocapsae TaxID=34508 RepID=A0A4U5NIX3_STECR|nr:hypothetical protein L596_016493 [Steinernema carpocapsae]